jgi:hypothetical protein
MYSGDWIRDRSREDGIVVRYWYLAFNRLNREEAPEELVIVRDTRLGGYNVKYSDGTVEHAEEFPYGEYIGRAFYDTFDEAYDVATRFIEKYPEGRR